MLKKTQETRFNDIEYNLNFAGIKIISFKWSESHILEIKVARRDYKAALNVMTMDCPTDVSSLFGLKRVNVLLFQFDRN